MSECLNRRKLRGSTCRVISEKYANTPASTYSGQHRFNGDDGGPLNKILHKLADRPRKAAAQRRSQNNTDETTDKTQDNRLDKKLSAYIPALRTNGFTQPNFRDALGDGHQHDIQDANSANNQSNRGDNDEDELNNHDNLVGRFQFFFHHPCLKELLAAVISLQDRLDFLHRLIHRLMVFCADQDMSDMIIPPKIGLCCGNWNKYLVVFTILGIEPLAP